MKFSANLGFLWNDLSLPNAIRAAKDAGFQAVEFHWPYDTAVAEVSAALQETGLPVLGLNTSRGDVAAGENGLSAVPGREAEARAAIDQAVEYASAVGAQRIHIMAGFAAGPEAEACFVEALKYAAEQVRPLGIGLLIEPLNRYDAPGYFLQTTTQAIDIIYKIDTPELKLMFDCYHVQLMEGDLSHRLEALQPYMGHIQFASVPDRGPPDAGEVNYTHIFNVIRDMGYTAPLGAEYKPKGPTGESLGWMETLGRMPI